MIFVNPAGSELSLMLSNHLTSSPNVLDTSLPTKSCWSTEFVAFAPSGRYLTDFLGMTTLPTSFSAKNAEMSNDRMGLTWSAVLLILCCVARYRTSSCVQGSSTCKRARVLLLRFLLWMCFSAQSEECVFLNVSVCNSVGVKRTWVQKLFAG